jgi:hypothetical protein
MKFTAVVLALAASAVALPNVGPSGAGAQKGKQMSQPGAKQEQFWPVAPNVSVDEAKAACGNQNQIACCDDVSFAGDTTEISSGPLAGALSDLLGGKNGAKGLGLFDKCSKLNIDREYSQTQISLRRRLTDFSDHWYQRPRQLPVQGQHCLLPEQQRRIREYHRTILHPVHH